MAASRHRRYKVRITIPVCYNFRLEHLLAVQGPFDAAFFNAVFGNLFDQREALLRASLLLRPGSRSYM